MTKSEFVYVTYIKTTPDKLWHALTNVEFMKQYWFGSHCDSEWKVGSSWKMVSAAGQITDAGEIIESQPPQRLVIKWQHQMKPELKEEGYTRCIYEIEPVGSTTKLTITHTIDKQPLQQSKMIEAVSGGWPKILSNLKSLLETGSIALEENVGCAASS